jgi:phosphatidylglycerol---prolipoprotein diacylglyceryl transferase
MTFFPDISTFIQIGTLEIKMYAVMILIGAFITYFVAEKNFVKMGYPKAYTEDLFFGTLFFGIVGARLWYVMFYYPEQYLANPLSILMTWQGGMAIQGGLFLGAAFGWWYARKKKIAFLRGADAIVPAILLAQAAGRWGNFFNQEAFGRTVTEAYYTFFPSFIKDMMFIQGAYREPTFLYESALNVIGFFAITMGLKHVMKIKRGDYFYGYLVWYGFTRFFVEGLRTDSLYVWGTFIRTAQVISIFFILLGLLGFFGVFDKLRKKVKPIILFDLDGTLLDTELLIIETFKAVLKKFKPELVVTREMELSFLGPTLTESFGKLLPEDQVQPAFDAYRTLNKELHPKYVKAMPGAKALLEDLKAKGYTLGIVSSKKKDAVELGLSLTSLSSYFSVIIGYDEVKKFKPDPEGLLNACKALNVYHDDVIYVGDTDTDMLAADKAGMYSVAYLTHPERQEALLATKPNAVIEHLSELTPLLEQPISWTRTTT